MNNNQFHARISICNVSWCYKYNFEIFFSGKWRSVAGSTRLNNAGKLSSKVISEGLRAFNLNAGLKENPITENNLVWES